MKKTLLITIIELHLIFLFKSSIIPSKSMWRIEVWLGCFLANFISYYFVNLYCWVARRASVCYAV